MKNDTKTKRAPSPQSAPLPAKAAVYTVTSLQEVWELLRILYAEKFGQDVPTDRRTCPNRPTHIDKNIKQSRHVA